MKKTILTTALLAVSAAASAAPALSRPPVPAPASAVASACVNECPATETHVPTRAPLHVTPRRHVERTAPPPVPSAPPAPLAPRISGPTSLQMYEQADPIALSRRAYAAASAHWLHTGIAPGLVGTNGAVMYAYGQSRPVVTCAPLHICTIELLPGEHVTDLSIGDSVRWLVQNATAGNQPVIVVKPTTAGLVTNLVVTTDAGRVYYLTLVSDAAAYIPLIGFYDPQQLVINVHQQAAVAEQQAATAAKRKADATVAQMPDVDPASLDFNYKVRASKDIPEAQQPVRVFSAKGHTYIQMDPRMQFTDAPTVFDMVDGKLSLVNFRLKGDYFIIDGVPGIIKLTFGAGKEADAITITHGGAARDTNTGLSWFDHAEQ